MATPVFFEISWSILSMICMSNVFFGLLVCGITSFSPLAAVPMISSAGGAIACGLCFYINYGTNPTLNRAIASPFADLFWMMQEAGLMFYSYLILRRVLRGNRRIVFTSIFWAIMLGVFATRVTIAVYRIESILSDTYSIQVTINYLHISYFSLMAILECISAYYLIDVFTKAKRTSMEIAVKVGIFRYLTRSTEVRVAILAVQGIFRTFTHSFQTPGQKAENLASQLDRFAYTLFCLFPIICYVDLLASKLAYSDNPYSYGSNSRSRAAHISNRNQFTSSNARGEEYPGQVGHVVEVQGGKNAVHHGANSSQERIFEGGSSQTGTSEIDMDDLDPKGNTIKKTVEFKVV